MNQIQTAGGTVLPFEKISITSIFVSKHFPWAFLVQLIWYSITRIFDLLYNSYSKKILLWFFLNKTIEIIKYVTLKIAYLLKIFINLIFKNKFNPLSFFFNFKNQMSEVVMFTTRKRNEIG